MMVPSYYLAQNNFTILTTVAYGEMPATYMPVEFQASYLLPSRLLLKQA
jgi:hypothetical protein